MAERVNQVAYIALGSNVGDRERHLAEARSMIYALEDSRTLAESMIAETAPLGGVAEGNFLNQMLAVETSLPPETLLARLLAIERRLGRTRTEKWASRTIDLDIVMYGDHRVDSNALSLPHPQLPHRDFWQRELIELRGDWR